MNFRDIFRNLILVYILVSAFSNGQAQVIQAFTQRASNVTPSRLIYNIRGDFTMIGNTNLTLVSYDNFTNNSNNSMQYVDIDGDPNTLNSSSSTLQFSTENGAVPECSNIIYAGLYWTGRSSNSAYSPEEFTVTKGAVTKTYNKRKIQFKGPGQSGYTEFVANPGDIYYPTSSEGNMYSAYVEVTDYVQNAGLGEYFAADIAMIEGNGGQTGYYGGWGMIVVYENSKMNWRDVTIFDGHAYVQGLTTINYELPVTGFHTVQSGPVNMKLGMMAGEGDVGINGDYFRVRNWQDDAWVTLDHSGNSTNNFFNSSVNTGGNPRNPSLQNNTGVDIAMFNIPNPGNSVVTNNQTSTKFQYGSTQDTYVIFCIAMAVDAYIPDVAALISTETINGIPVGSGPITVLPGQDIEYKLEVRNLGTEPVDNVQFVIPLPYTTSFNSGSEVTQINFVPPPIPNNVYYDPLLGSNGSVVWDFGTLPMPPVGFPDSVLAELIFEMKVTEDCFILSSPDCSPTVALSGATVSGIGSISGVNFKFPFIQGYDTTGLCLGEPITEPLIIEIDADAYVLANCSSTLPLDFVFCNYTETTIPVDSIEADFPTGLGFYNTNSITQSSIKYDDENPFPATLGTSTYFAIPDGENSCYYTFTITVQAPYNAAAVMTSPVSCPGGSDGSINLSVSGGTSPYIFDWTGPGVYSASTEDIASLIAGTYNVSITDDLGCVGATSAIVTTTPDLTNPVIGCPSNLSLNSDLGMCSIDGTNFSLGAPVVSDNCIVGSVINDAPLVYPVGITVVTWTATDQSLNAASCIQTVTVIDIELPTITCPADVAVDSDAGDCFADATSVTLGAPITADNCGVTPATNNAPATYSVGTTTVVWTVIDIHGNSNTCNQLVVVTDNEDPTITCPADVAVDSDAGQCYATSVSLGTPTTNDNCGVATVTNNAPSVFFVGTTTVTWTVTDIHGNTITCDQDVVVTDNEDPTITCPADVAVDSDAGLCEATTVSLGTPNTNDNCGVATFTNNAPATYLVGTTTVTWTVTDIHGNTITCDQDVVVTDNEDPTITCPADVAVDSDAGLCEATTVSLGTPTTNDNCGVATVTNDAPSTYLVGTTIVTWTVTDVNGNFVTCTQNVIVTDNEDPTIICPADVAVNNDPALCSASSVILGTPTTNDNCGVATVTNNAPSVFSVGTTIVTWTVTDIHGNSITCDQNVVVTDNELPVTTNCPANINTCSPTVTYTAPTATDNCGVSTIVQTSGLGSGAMFPIGLTIEEYTITDVNGNVTICSFEVIVFPTPVASFTATNVTCFAAADGTIDLSVTDGTAPYSFVWSTGETSEDVLNLAPGIYEVTVTDFFGCQTVTGFVISQPDTISITEIHTNVSCDGLSDGSVTIEVEGGATPYLFDWSNGSTNQDLVTLPAGIYDLTLTDNNGCEYDLSVEITQPDTLSASATTLDATCLSIDGTLDLTVEGGTTPYAYVWSNAATTQDLADVAAGIYEVTITDGNGCQFVFTDTILSTNPIGINANVQDALCYGDRNGLIDITVTNAVEPISYLWSTGDTSSVIINALAGDYTVTVTDSNQCTLTVTYTIEQPDSLYIELYSPTFTGNYNVSTYLGTDGSIETTVTGGTSPYEFLWSEGSTSQDLLNLPAGNYAVLVTDENGCTVQASIILTSPWELEMPTGYSPNGDGQNDFFVVHGIEVFPDNEITVYNRWGNVVYSTTGYQNQWNGFNNSGEEIPDGTYFVILTIAGLDEPLTGYVDLRRKH